MVRSYHAAGQTRSRWKANAVAPARDDTPILLYADAADAWGTAVAGAEFTPEHRARMRSVITWAATTAAAVVDMAYHAGGGSSIYAANPLQRRFRDVHAITQHFLVKLDTFTTAGAVLAGAEADLTVF